MKEPGWPRRLHATVDRLDGWIRPALRRMPVLDRLWVRLLDRVVALQPDRLYMRETILPTIARAGLGSVLFVGVRGYTRGYAEVFRQSRTEFWTSDIDPAAAPHGAPGRHVTGDARRLEQSFPAGCFDLVVLNGVLGWGIDGPAAMDQALVSAHLVLGRGGYLLLGWNRDRMPDPDTLASIGTLFAPTDFLDLPHRKTFRDVTHVYAWYRGR